MPRSVPPVVLATRLLKAGRPAEAIAPLREAVGSDPGSAALAHDFGLACLEADRWDEAVGSLRRAVALRPDYTDAHFRLGLALERAGDLHGAVLAYDRATALRPSLTEAWFRAGSIVFTLGHREEAIGCFRRAASSGRGSSFGRLGEARALLAAERDAEAERVLRFLLARDAGNAVAHDLLGNVLADAGRFDEARDCFARAIEAGPLMAGCFYDLVRCRRIGAADTELLARMEAALPMPALQTEQRIRLHLALGKAHDDRGEHEAAMKQFDAADAVRRTIVRFDAAEFERQVGRLIELFPGEAVARTGRRDGGGEGEGGPILIMGLPRSGTTLTEQIVSSHPAVAAGGEINFWNERGARWMSDGAPALDASWLAGAAADYRAVLRAVSGAVAPERARVTDKMPFNFLWAGLVHAALPDAVMLHCRRAPIDTALSIHQTHFNPRLAFPTGGTDLVRYVRAHDRLSAHWRRVLPADRYLEVSYDDLTGRPDETIRRAIGFCRLDWHEDCLRPERNQRRVRTPSRWQARQPINRDAIARWRRYEPWLGELATLTPMPAP